MKQNPNSQNAKMRKLKQNTIYMPYTNNTIYMPFMHNSTYFDAKCEPFGVQRSMRPFWNK